MAVYQAYVLDEDGHYAAAKDLDGCNSDDDAIQQASQFVNGRDVDVWDGERLIATLISHVKKAG